MAGKLEHRGRDLKEDPDRLEKKNTERWIEWKGARVMARK